LNYYKLNCISLVEHNAFHQTFPHRFKRKGDDGHDLHQRRKPKLISTNDNSSTLSKNALMLLYELKPSIEYKLIAQTGPSHRPMFTMGVEINGEIFEGIAQTKKEAKQAGKYY
jgi:dsRNA-specific ribonuclease